jgi:hypothetical protein
MGIQGYEARRNRMANDSSGVKARKKKRGGWVEVEEIPSPQSTISPAGASASEVPKSLLTIERIHQIVRRVTGALSYEALPELAGLSLEKQNLIIENIVYGCELSLSVSEIQSIIDRLKKLSADNAFPGLIQIAERYRRVTGELLDRLNRRVDLGVPQ